MNASAVTLAVLAGVALVTQSAIMLAITGRGFSLTSALLFNSLVGVLLLAGLEVLRAGTGFAAEFSQHVKLWFVLPGLLGTFFVFASLYGYKHIGAATTITLIIASQIITGMVMDALTLHANGQQFFNFQKLWGAGLLAVGSLLILRSS